LDTPVAVANSRGPESLAALAAETGATAEAARDKDLVIVTIPEKDIPKLPAGLFADAVGSVVVDTGNYYPRQRDGRIEPIESGLPESRWVEQQLGHPVIKAFNDIYAQHRFCRVKAFFAKNAFSSSDGSLVL
jgi:predicted dinucleotide-binding enzyme